MKKLVLLAAVVFSVSMIACGNKDQAQEVAEEAAAPAVEAVEEAAVVVDSVAPDSVEVAVAEVAEAAAPAAE